MSSVSEYLETYALISLEKQEKLASLIGEHIADIDFDAGRIRFSGDFEFPFQVLGAESDNTLSWLWAWADEHEEVSPDLLKAALQLKAWGTQTGVREFTVPSVGLDRADGHVFSMIASGVCEASCYYREGYEGGALFLLLFGDSIDRQPALDLAGLTRQFSNLISLSEFNHRKALVSYLQLKGLRLNEQGTVMTLELESAERVKAEFDSAGILKTMNGRRLPFD